MTDSRTPPAGDEPGFGPPQKSSAASAWSQLPSPMQGQFHLPTQNPYADVGGDPDQPHLQPKAPQQVAAQQTTPRAGVGDFVPRKIENGPKIERYRRSRVWTIIIPLAAIAVALGLLYFGTRPAPVDSKPQQTPSSYRPASPTRTGLPAEVQFTNGRVSGTFAISSSSWTGNTLSVRVSITLDQGSLNYSFMALDVTTGDISRPISRNSNGELRAGRLQAGQSISGTVKFVKDRNDTQVALSEGNTNRNLTIIRVPG